VFTPRDQGKALPSLPPINLRRSRAVHQPLKKRLGHQPRDRTLQQLQAQLDRFEAFIARTKATPTPPSTAAIAEHRVRRDIVDSDGKLTLRYAGQLRHLGAGTHFAGTRVHILVADRDVRVLTTTGQELGRYRLDPARNYHARLKP
jgi:hypothetical protein